MDAAASAEQSHIVVAPEYQLGHAKLTQGLFENFSDQT
jgi:hypothetical protein